MTTNTIAALDALDLTCLFHRLQDGWHDRKLGMSSIGTEGTSEASSMMLMYIAYWWQHNSGLNLWSVCTSPIAANRPYHRKLSHGHYRSLHYCTNYTLCKSFLSTCQSPPDAQTTTLSLGDKPEITMTNDKAFLFDEWYQHFGKKTITPS